MVQEKQATAEDKLREVEIETHDAARRAAGTAANLRRTAQKATSARKDLEEIRRDATRDELQRRIEVADGARKKK